MNMYTPHVWIPRLGTNLNRYTKANETANSVDLVNAPEAVSQQGTPFSTDIMNEMEEGITDANAGIGLLATGDTAAATQIKEIDMSDYTIKVGMHIDVDFTNGNTVGSVEDGGIASGANIVTKGAGEQIRIIGYNGMFLFNEKIGGEYAGSGCHNAGDCHEMVITTMATGNASDTAGVIKNKDANDIYNVVGSLYSYRKQRDGQIHKKFPLRSEERRVGKECRSSYAYVEDGLLHIRLDLIFPPHTIRNAQQVFSLSGDLTQLVNNPVRIVAGVDVESAGNTIRYDCSFGIYNTGEAYFYVRDGVTSGGVTNAIGIHTEAVVTANPYYPKTSA